jgi:hypothetical protein
VSAGPRATDSAAERIQASIARLIRLRREGRVASGPPARPPASRRDLLDLPGASVRRSAAGEALVVRRPLAELLPDDDVAGELEAAFAALEACTAGGDPADPAGAVDRGLLPAVGRRLDEMVVLDLETTGFWGCPIFLVGMLLVDGGEPVTLQVLARDYPEERAMLEITAGILAGRGLLVTFNGKSYDVPCLRDRSVVHRVEATVDGLPHVDILHPARRRWAGELPDCRLQTLERTIVGLHRAGDVPSAEIPGIYHAFTADGEPGPLLPVLHHSRVDVVTTARVFARLAVGGGTE